jgi:hypothetical protein
MEWRCFAPAIKAVQGPPVQTPLQQQLEFDLDRRAQRQCLHHHKGSGRRRSICEKRVPSRVDLCGGIVAGAEDTRAHEMIDRPSLFIAEGLKVV